MKRLPKCVFICILFGFTACDNQHSSEFLYQTDPETKKLVLSNYPEYPDMDFLVLADTHYFAPELGTSGSAFEEYLKHDRKMLKESSEILNAAVGEIKKTTADFIIICGDLTKDGELESHQQFASVLADIESSGKKVFVVPGNHDISNGEAMSFTGTTSQRVPTVEPETFKLIYSRYGFSEAIAVDSDSLSYIVEPVEGVWFFGLDSCRYRENTEDGHPVTDGKFYDKTLSWIEQQLIEAITQKKAVIGFLHHGILEHYPANEKHFDDYLLENFDKISKMFSAYGMRFVFTGHYHAQDITKKTWLSDIPNHFLMDIETGSLVTYPVPMRRIAVKNQTMTITSDTIQSITSQPDGFPAFAEQFVQDGMTGIINETLTEYGVPESDQSLLTPQISEAYVTHLWGDEVRAIPYLDFTGVSPLGVLVGVVQGDLIRGWYTDLPPTDNSLRCNMQTGHIE